MSDCEVSYKLILPDGETFDFDHQSGFVVGTSGSTKGHEGFGMPPVQHVSQELYQNPGGLFRQLNAQPRAVTLTVTTWATDKTRAGLHRIRSKLNNAVRMNRGALDITPSILCYTVDNVSRNIELHYAGEASSRLGREGRAGTMAVKFIAYDPMWYHQKESTAVLDFVDTFTMRHALGRENGLWNPMGPPAAVAAGVAGPDIYAVAVDPLNGDVYFGGDFTNWDNIALADYIVRWNGTAWEAIGDDGVGGPALTERVEALYFGPDNTLYVGGWFTNAGGVANADYLAAVEVHTNTWSAPANAPGEVAGRIIRDIVVGNDNYIYVAGTFTNWAGVGAADYIAKAPLGGAWAGCDTGLNGAAYCLAKSPLGDIVVGGIFTNAGGTSINRIAWYDVSANNFLDMGGGSPGGGTAIWNVAFAPDGRLYATGNCPTMGTDAITVNNIASWNGAYWEPLGTGLGNIGYGLAIDSRGWVWVTGAFTTAGGLTVDRFARWMGTEWGYVDVLPPVTGNIYRGLAIAANDNVYLGCREVGITDAAADTAVVNLGNAKAWPRIEISNAGLLKTLTNETTGDEILFDLQLLDVDVMTINLAEGHKTATSNWRGITLGDIMSSSDLATLGLESYPRANYGNVRGSNLITLLIDKADPREVGDNNNQLSGYENITGVSPTNSDKGRLYISLLAEGGGWYHIEFFSSSARDAASRVANTVSFFAAGTEDVRALDNSGLGGTITIDALVGADTDIVVTFTMAHIYWTPRWWDVDSAVS